MFTESNLDFTTSEKGTERCLMVAQNMLRTCEGKQEFTEPNFKIAKKTLDLMKSIENSKSLISLTGTHIFLSYHLIQIPCCF